MTKKFSIKNAQIYKSVQDALKHRSEYGYNIYNDGCWSISIEVHMYGCVRTWVSYDDKRDGTYGSSLVYVHNNEVCGASFNIKNAVKKKLISVWNYLLTRGVKMI